VYPYLLHSGHLTIPTFGVLAAIGLMLGLTLSLRTARLVGLEPDTLWDAGLFGVIAAFVFSRLLLVIENLHSFLQYPIALLEVPSLTASGMLVTALATIIWLKIKRAPPLRVADAWAPCATLVWSFLALGHFCDGSDPGMHGLPVALFVAAYASLLTGGLLVWLKWRGERTAALGLAGAGLGQFLLSFWREPDLSGVTTLLDPLQWVAVGMMVGAAVIHATQGLGVEGRND